MICQIVQNYYLNGEDAQNNFVSTYLPVLSFAFLIVTFVLDRALARRATNKKIIRDWYKKVLLEPCGDSCNLFFLKIKELTAHHLTVFDKKSNSLPLTEFLRYKAHINDQFERIKIEFYNESLVPIYQNYPTIADSLNNVILKIQDDFVVLFGGQLVTKESYDLFLDQLYSGKGKILAILEMPLSSRGKAKLKID